MQSPAARLFARGLLLLLAVSTALLALIYWRIYGVQKMFGDFDVFYQAARHAATGQWQAIYDIPRLHALLAAGDSGLLSFFLNPPTALFLVYPLGFLNTAPALFVWTAAQIVLLALILRMAYARQLFGTSTPNAVPTPVLLAVVFLAFSLQDILFGQVALLCASLFLPVLALRRTNPVLAGVLLGIFSFKPQLGVVLPVLLLAEKNWKCLFWAAAVTLTMIALSYFFFGAGLWQDYRETLGILSAFLARPQPTLFALNLSPNAALRNLGLPAAYAMPVQLIISAIVLIYIWPALKGSKETHKIPVVALATYLVSPYSLLYDMVLLAIPCALLLRRAEADKAGFYELIALLLLIALPLVALLLQLMHIPYGVIAIGVALGVARRRAVHDKNNG